MVLSFCREARVLEIVPWSVPAEEVNVFDNEFLPYGKGWVKCKISREKSVDTVVRSGRILR